MRIILLTLFFWASGVAVTAQPASNEEMARNLMKNKKYLSAYNTLIGNDGDYLKTVLCASELVLAHSVNNTSDYDQWLLVDFEGTVRGKEEYVHLDIANLLLEAINQFPKECALYSWMVRYQILFFRQSTFRIITDDIMALKKAYPGFVPEECKDGYFELLMGQLSNSLNDSRQSLTHLQKASVTMPNDYRIFYEMAVSHYLLKDYTAALNMAGKALPLAQSRYEKSPVYRLMGDIYDAKNDLEKAFKNYQLADSSSAKDYFNVKALLNYYVKTKDNRAAGTVSLLIGSQSQNRQNLKYYLDVFDIFKKHNQLMELAKICEKELEKYANRPEIMARYYFLLGFIHQPTNPDLAKQYLQLAKKNGLSWDYESTHLHPNTSQTVNSVMAWAGLK